jgi:glucose-6-phosphate 1-dehydrogenase
VEKPFGADLQSARSLNTTVHRHFDESQVYRIDHYLGKETVQNLLAFRFANPMFEAVWNREHVEQVEILVAEDLGIGTRAAYYETTGALRDMVQNHLTQLLALVTMEPPNRFEAERIRNEKVKVVEAIVPLRPDDVVCGQYDAGTVGGTAVPGYREEPGVAPDSTIPTFVGLRIHLDTWRWHGVPFYLRTGKRLPKRLTQVAVTFRPPPLCFFRGDRDGCDVERDVLLITLQPDEGFSLGFNVKSPGRVADLDTQNLHFRYGEAYGPLPQAYETLLLDIIEGDQSLFVRADEAEASWAAYQPVLDHRPEPHRYTAGTWGPPDLDQGVPLAGTPWMGR